MLARFLAGGACAVGMLAAVFVAPAAAHPYDQSIRGRSFFGALFGPSIARAMVSYPAIRSRARSWSARRSAGSISCSATARR
jgi:hypothetical protein